MSNARNVIDPNGTAFNSTLSVREKTHFDSEKASIIFNRMFFVANLGVICSELYYFF